MQQSLPQPAQLRVRGVYPPSLTAKNIRSSTPSIFFNEIVIPKPQHFVAPRFQKLCPLFIPLAILRLAVLASVEFDNKSGLAAEEIGDVRSDRLLSAEFEFAS